MLRFKITRQYIYIYRERERERERERKRKRAREISCRDMCLCICICIFRRDRFIQPKYGQLSHYISPEDNKITFGFSGVLRRV